MFSAFWTLEDCCLGQDSDLKLLFFFFFYHETDLCNVRVIVRDVAGKYAWDATHIYGLVPETRKRTPSPPPRQRALSINLELAPDGDEQNTKAKLDFLTKVHPAKKPSMFC